jgi:putative Ca2+/H+ antiporter (TMEM165/GDT1 family)
LRLPGGLRIAMVTWSLGSSRPRVQRGMRQQTRALALGAFGLWAWRDLWLESLDDGVGRESKPLVRSPDPQDIIFMDVIFISLAVVAAAEIGDKTQLLALLLAAKFRKPLPVVAGIFVATILNHGIAAWIGVAVAEWLGPEMLRWIVGLSFIGMAAWTLVPDKMDDDPKMWERAGAFVATTVSFFLVEIGDKTQVATVALGARFGDLIGVTTGTTLGMLIADVPAVFVGGAMADRLPLKLVRTIAAALFAIMGILALTGVGGSVFG